MQDSSKYDVWFCLQQILNLIFKLEICLILFDEILVQFPLVLMNIYFKIYLRLCIHEGSRNFIWIVISGPNFFTLQVKAELRIQTIYRQRFSSSIQTQGRKQIVPWGVI